MRLTDADREQFYEELKRHSAEGGMSLDELERRVGIVASAQTREEALVVLADLPSLPPAPGQALQDRPRRGRGHAETDAPRAAWRPTDERFRDPGTGRVMRVWVDASGGRHYVPD